MDDQDSTDDELHHQNRAPHNPRRNNHRENKLQSDHSQNQRESEQQLANNHSEYRSQSLQEPDSHPSVLNPSYQQRVHRRDRPIRKSSAIFPVRQSSTFPLVITSGVMC